MAERPFQSYAEARDYLYGLKHRGAVYGIDRMRHFTERLGYPQKQYPTIHVAGTNGKGSTCALLESVFRTAGYKTGMFTSPHLIHQGERVQVNREILSHESIVEFTNRLRPVAEDIESGHPDHHPTFFEFMTAMAFSRFASEKVDIGIVETGLGGRLDATNVLSPEVCVITSIGLDHTDILGDTLEKIAGEKAGILKPGVPVVLGDLLPEAEAVFLKRAGELGCEVFRVVDFYRNGKMPLPECGLPGDYQRRNAAVAALTCQVLGKKFPNLEPAIEDGLQTATWAGRWDKREIAGRTVVFDSTHNPEGAEELDKNLKNWVSELGENPIILCGTLGEQRAEALMPVVARYAKKIILLKPKQPRACEFETLKAFIPNSFEGEIEESQVEKLIPRSQEFILPPLTPILITGSIYLIGEIMDKLYHEQPVGEEKLQD